METVEQKAVENLAGKFGSRENLETALQRIQETQRTQQGGYLKQCECLAIIERVTGKSHCCSASLLEDLEKHGLIRTERPGEFHSHRTRYQITAEGVAVCHSRTERMAAFVTKVNLEKAGEFERFIASLPDGLCQALATIQRRDSPLVRAFLLKLAEIRCEDSRRRAFNAASVAAQQKVTDECAARGAANVHHSHMNNLLKYRIATQSSDPTFQKKLDDERAEIDKKIRKAKRAMEMASQRAHRLHSSWKDDEKAAWLILHGKLPEKFEGSAT